MDATFASGLGRLVNDAPSRSANCVMKKRIIGDKTPYLALYALRDLTVGEELRYDYGVSGLPWRKKKGIYIYILHMY